MKIRGLQKIPKEFLGILLMVLSLFCGCGTADLPDTYQEGTDSQYFQYTNLLRNPTIQQTEGGCYVLQGEYVYFFDKNSEKIMPLCNKPDCLHDRETDPEKKGGCNAYLNGLVTTGFEAKASTLQLCDPYLYVCYYADPIEEEDPNSQYVVYRFSMDGTTKERVWQTQATVNEFVVHRGHAYVALGSYSINESGVNGGFQLLDIDLQNSLFRKEKEVSSKQVGAKLSALAKVMAYGNYVYFKMHEGGEDVIYIYSIKSGEVSKLEFETEEPEGWQVNNITFFQDKLMVIGYIIGSDATEELYDPANIYMMDLDGGNPRIVLRDIPQGYYIGSDGRYFYLTNAFNTAFGKKELDPVKTFWVYDADFQLVDTFTVPDTAVGFFDPPLGEPDCQYLTVQEEDRWGLQIWEKSGIGSYDGAAYEQKTVWYPDGENADSASR